MIVKYSKGRGAKYAGLYDYFVFMLFALINFSATTITIVSFLSGASLLIISKFCFTCRPKFLSIQGKRILKQLTATLRPAVSKRWVHVDDVPINGKIQAM